MILNITIQVHFCRLHFVRLSRVVRSQIDSTEIIVRELQDRWDRRLAGNLILVSRIIQDANVNLELVLISRAVVLHIVQRVNVVFRGLWLMMMILHWRREVIITRVDIVLVIGTMWPLHIRWYCGSRCHCLGHRHVLGRIYWDLVILIVLVIVIILVTISP